MKTLLRKYLIISLSVYLVSLLGLGLELENGLNGLLFASTVLFLLLIFKPLIDTLMFPINLLTLNLTNWILYIFIIFIWSMIVPDIRFLSLNFSGIKTSLVTLGPMMIPYWLSVIINSLFIVILIKFFNWISK